MRSKHRSRKRSKNAMRRDQRFAKIIFQTATAFVLLAVIWIVSTSEQASVRAFCDKIRHYLTYTVDVKSVFKPITENNALGVNENAH